MATNRKQQGEKERTRSLRLFARSLGIGTSDGTLALGRGGRERRGGGSCERSRKVKVEVSLVCLPQPKQTEELELTRLDGHCDG